MRSCRPPFGGRWRHRHGWAPWEAGDAGRPSPNRLYRNLDTAMVKGVCAGVADYFGISPWLVRIGTLILLFSFTVPTIIVYFVLVKMVPPRPAGLYETSEEEAFWTRVRVEPAGMVSNLRRQFRDMEKRLRDLETYVTSREFGLDREIKDL
ncbi:envelope stress response membrane protein PspC [Shumkonia mesophila]|uniref:envelope stress response membrane protein PspC n=1 Tax=Shumkonia mesophila TaxID=2838854 RepID=UPI002934E442|nr:envelope stress response membrane protein PspC [Shumkonia mesophila]